MSENLKIYNKLREVPKDAQKEIRGGRLSGMTDINPMWRIKVMTELFGPCGFGWKYTIDKKWIEAGSANQLVGFVDITLYYKHEGEWSEGISANGGSMFLANEKNGPYTSDEVYKMATTDALGVAMKMLGVGADVYWSADRTKYTSVPEGPRQVPAQQTPILNSPLINEGLTLLDRTTYPKYDELKQKINKAIADKNETVLNGLKEFVNKYSFTKQTWADLFNEDYKIYQ